MIELADKIAQSSGRVVDLGNEEYKVTGKVAVTGDRVITGNGAVIHHRPDNARDCSCLYVRGAGTRLEGNVTIRGFMPDGNRYDSDREAQHGICVESAVNPFIGGWMVSNVFGDGIYVSKRARGKPWTEGLVMDGTRFDECGRCSLTLQAARNTSAANLNIQRSNMSVIDAEPNGADWGCQGFTWTDSIVRDHGGGFVFASIGKGRNNAVCNIKIMRVHCPNREFNMNVRSPEGTRRSNFWIEDVSGRDFATNPFRFTRVDGVTLRKVNQPASRLVTLTDCTHWDVPGSVSPNPPPEF